MRMLKKVGAGFMNEAVCELMILHFVNLLCHGQYHLADFLVELKNERKPHFMTKITFLLGVDMILAAMPRKKTASMI